MEKESWGTTYLTLWWNIGEKFFFYGLAVFKSNFWVVFSFIFLKNDFGWHCIVLCLLRFAFPDNLDLNVGDLDWASCFVCCCNLVCLGSFWEFQTAQITWTGPEAHHIPVRIKKEKQNVLYRYSLRKNIIYYWYGPHKNLASVQYSVRLINMKGIGGIKIVPLKFYGNKPSFVLWSFFDY